jgi:hypothetical protein
MRIDEEEREEIRRASTVAQKRMEMYGFAVELTLL